MVLCRKFRAQPSHGQDETRKRLTCPELPGRLEEEVHSTADSALPRDFASYALHGFASLEQSCIWVPPHVPGIAAAAGAQTIRVCRDRH
ncbi:hypothetical protein HPB50_023632 [Hyalomma asiaticum]|uniref:Uncharacterized protein n=1 Tax=Hyalomma asiaticum TaxID=266040 RepID=A0ACB7T6S8_HYAAI|nr:hypothetical protein HPB50_023632 [Hyalomma asiaticum]